MSVFVARDLGVADDAQWTLEYPFFLERVNVVIWVKADGPELEAILAATAGIPIVAGAKAQTWYGDDAKFIVTNVLNGVLRGKT